MGYSPQKKPLDLKEFLSIKGKPQRKGWRSATASTARKPAQAVATSAAPAPDKPRTK